uniref:RING-type domain-containing protein n=1 Tax=Anopheles atroparvus TaxID=41427 RepID=A0A182IX56_ANOAO
MEMMYAETHRLSSFEGWPAEDATTVTETHRRLSPECPFILHPECTDNVRIFDRGELKDEQLRLSTFVHWPVPFISRQALAKSGFYYTHQSDEVQCAYCAGVIGRWEVGDDPFVEHEKFFPTCQKVIENAISSDPIPDPSIGIQPVQMPHVPGYSTLDSRIRSFERWTMGHVQDPVLLSQAGFYYLGVADEVRCFHCDGGLRFWLVDDDPWFEHARCFPKCQFVQLVKGQLFIENVQTQIKQSSASSQQQQHHLEQSQSSSGAVVPSMSLEDALLTEPVQMALLMGLNVGRIRAATMRHLNTFGQPFLTSHELVEAVLDDQIEQQDLQPTTSSRMGRRIENELTQWISTAISSSVAAAQQQTHAQPLIAHVDCVPDGPSSSHIPKLADKSDTVKDETSTASSVPDAHSAAASKMLTDEASVRLEEENKRLKDARECKICMSDEVGVVFCPCGHLVSCVQCAPAVIKCPVCRALIKGRVRTFLS